MTQPIWSGEYSGQTCIKNRAVVYRAVCDGLKFKQLGPSFNFKTIVWYNNRLFCHEDRRQGNHLTFIINYLYCQDIISLLKRPLYAILILNRYVCTCIVINSRKDGIKQWHWLLIDDQYYSTANPQYHLNKLVPEKHGYHRVNLLRW